MAITLTADTQKDTALNACLLLMFDIQFYCGYTTRTCNWYFNLMCQMDKKRYEPYFNILFEFLGLYSNKKAGITHKIVDLEETETWICFSWCIVFCQLNCFIGKQLWGGQRDFIDELFGFLMWVNICEDLHWRFATAASITELFLWEKNGPVCNVTAALCSICHSFNPYCSGS